MNPKVFVSHASEDKERFVLDFATKLRAKGIDAWLDQWEMKPGDSLVDKIFEEGIKEAGAFIIILSENSVNKPWVKQELNTAIVKRIDKGTQIIPIVLDKCEVPESLKSTVWERINNLNDYTISFDRVISKITGQNEKPKLGELPAYISTPIKSIQGLTKTDNLVLKLSAEYTLEEGMFLDLDIISSKCKSLDVSKEEILDSIEVLDNKGYLRVSRISGPIDYRISDNGLEKYAITYLPDYSEMQTKVISLLVNQGVLWSEKVSEKLGKPQIIIDLVFKQLELNNYVRLTKYDGGDIMVNYLSPELKRLLS